MRPYDAYSGHTSGYGYSRHIPEAIASLEFPAETILLGDAEGPGNYRIYSRAYYSDCSSSWTYIAPRHNGGANIGLCDGHAKWYQVTLPHNDCPEYYGGAVGELRWN